MIEAGLTLFFGVLLALGVVGAAVGLVAAAWKRDPKLAVKAVRHVGRTLLYAGLPLTLVVVGRLPAILAGGICLVFGYNLGLKAAARKQSSPAPGSRP